MSPGKRYLHVRMFLQIRFLSRKNVLLFDIAICFRYNCELVVSPPESCEFFSCNLPGADVYNAPCAGVAQLVEHLTCNEDVGGSIPLASSIGLSGSLAPHKTE